MTGENDTDITNGGQDADFAKAFKDLEKGEKTADQLEQQLTAMESKITELLEKTGGAQESTQSSTAQDMTEHGKSIDG